MKNIPFIWKKEKPIKTNIYQHRQKHTHIYRNSYIKTRKNMTKLELHSHPPHRRFWMHFSTHTYTVKLTHTQTQRSRHSHRVLKFRTSFRLSQIHTYKHKSRQRVWIDITHLEFQLFSSRKRRIIVNHEKEEKMCEKMQIFL